MTTVKEHNMGFKPAMALAILRGTKTMTRRLITPRNSYYDGGPVRKARWEELDWASPDIFVDKGPSPSGNSGPYLHVPDKDCDCTHRIYPRYQPGDGLWGRERHSIGSDMSGRQIIATHLDDADGRLVIGESQVMHPEAPEGSRSWCLQWKRRPSIHMPRWASRITLEVTGVRVERLQDISEQDALSEGITYHDLPNNGLDPMRARTWFRGLWESINGPGSWALNPYVWVIQFRRLP